MLHNWQALPNLLNVFDGLMERYLHASTPDYVQIHPSDPEFVWPGFTLFDSRGSWVSVSIPVEDIVTHADGEDLHLSYRFVIDVIAVLGWPERHGFDNFDVCCHTTSDDIISGRALEPVLSEDEAVSDSGDDDAPCWS